MSDWPEILASYSQSLAQESLERKGLALLLQKEGHSFQPPGSAILFTETGPLAGTLGSCLDEDLFLRFQKLWQNGETSPRVIEVTSSGTAWELGIGCATRLVFLLLPFQKQCALLEAVKKAQQKHKALSIYVSKSSSPSLSFHLTSKIPSSLWEVQEKQNSLTLCFLPLTPYLILWGAVPVARAISDLASYLGWDVEVWDTRPARAKKEFFPSAKKIFATSHLSSFSPPSFPWGFVSLAHTDHIELELLDRLLGHPHLFYIGLMASRKRREWFFQELSKRGKGPLLSKLRSPIGLPLLGKSPKEIALSCIAEIQREWHLFFQSKS